MEELQLALTSARVDQRNFGLWINSWQVGQTLNALVQSQLPSGNLILRVGGQQVTATSDIPIQPGTQLLLEVKQLRPTPTLRVLTPQATPVASDAVGGTLRLLSAASGNSLATASLASVMQASQNLSGRAAAVPIVAESLGQLLKLASRTASLSRSDGVARAVRDSGIFLEAKLAAGSNPAHEAQVDLKAGLLRVLGRIDAALARAEALSLSGADAEALLTLKGELEAGLGRITTQQLASQPADATGGRNWQLEIPVQLAGEFHTLRLSIARDGHGGAEGAAADREATWRVTLQLELPALGEVELRLALRGDDRVNLAISAAQSGTRALLESGIAALGDAMASRGLKLAEVSTAPFPGGASKPSREDDAARGSVDISV